MPLWLCLIICLVGCMEMQQNRKFSQHIYTPKYLNLSDTIMRKLRKNPRYSTKKTHPGTLLSSYNTVIGDEALIRVTGLACITKRFKSTEKFYVYIRCQNQGEVTVHIDYNYSEVLLSKLQEMLEKKSST